MNKGKLGIQRKKKFIHTINEVTFGAVIKKSIVGKKLFIKFKLFTPSMRIFFEDKLTFFGFLSMFYG